MKRNKVNEQEFLCLLKDMIESGHSNVQRFHESMDFWVHMCLGEHGRQDHKGILSSSSNFIKKLTSSHKRQLNGKRIEDFFGLADEAMIRLGIENNLYEQDDMLHFGNNTVMLK